MLILNKRLKKLTSDIAVANVVEDAARLVDELLGSRPLTDEIGVLVNSLRQSHGYRFTDDLTHSSAYLFLLECRTPAQVADRLEELGLSLVHEQVGVLRKLAMQHLEVPHVSG